MSDSETTYDTLEEVSASLREQLGGKKYALLFAYNGTGKTRLSVEFKDQGKRAGNPDTLYFNAFTEDLFTWDNDLDYDKNRELRLNVRSRFFEGIYDIDIESRVQSFLRHYVDFDARISKKIISFEQAQEEVYQQSITLEDGVYYINSVSFDRDVIINGRNETIENIKISRGEENIFLWCFFLAISQLAFDSESEDDAYAWVEYIYIDDPISSLDENNLIHVACDLANLVMSDQVSQRVIISTHHTLFYNVLSNEFKSQLGRAWQKNLMQYFMRYDAGMEKYRLKQENSDTPFAYHLAVLEDLREAVRTDSVRHYHFNMMRSVLEKTAGFFGYKKFGDCIEDQEKSKLYSRLLNLFSHGKDSLFYFRELDDKHKELFEEILDMYLKKYAFNFPSAPAIESE